jgi:HD-GYP domain-containing protein (c-di-GMP phosphodiesterase class II)
MTQLFNPSLIDTVAAHAPESRPGEILAELQRTFDAAFALLDGQRGELIRNTDELSGGDWLLWGTLCSQVALRGQPELIDERDPLVLLAIPFSGESNQRLVAVAPFLTQPARTQQSHTRLAEVMGSSVAGAAQWAERQRIWSHEALLRLAKTFQEKTGVSARLNTLGAQVDALSAHLAETYEEIALLYRLTENLRLSDGVEEIGGRALDWLLEVLPAEGVAAVFSAATRFDPFRQEETPAAQFVTRGDFPLSHDEFATLVSHLGIDASRQSVVVNANGISHVGLSMPARNMVVAPLASGSKVYGYLAAADHDSGGEFGTVEARLLGSVATILGIHCGNVVLYREQSELFAGVVRALSSAIDAKDRYTCGHSDRVARVAVRLAEELGLSDNQQRTLYLAGLLHDVGKIGIKDEVLRKPGKLTPEEYEHIKLHPALGYEILRGLKKIEHVLPAVLHHHESWDGSGYPHGLAGEAIPFIARIVAVADAFDAMGSDRPYRKGMNDGTLDAILHDGSGKQWDARVIDAFFRARDDIRDISRRERQSLKLDLQPLV